MSTCHTACKLITLQWSVKEGVHLSSLSSQISSNDGMVISIVVNGLKLVSSGNGLISILLNVIDFSINTIIITTNC